MTAAIRSGELPVVVAEPESVPQETLAALSRLGPVRLGPFDRPGLIRAVASAGVLMVRLHHRIDVEVLAAAPGLRAILSATTGLNHIDVAACRARSIDVICVGGERAFLATITGTAELALALLLDLARHVVPAFADVRAGRWRRDAFRGLSVRGLTLGIVGLGRLGCVMAGYAEALGMHVVAADPAPTVVPSNVKLTSLHDLLATADAVTLHASHDQGHPPVLGAVELKSMKPGAFLVNTARGELVDEEALLASLASGHLGGYAADVIANETSWPDPSQHPLVRYASDHDNVIITPHIGGATVEAMARAEAFIVGKALRHFGVDPAPLPG